MDSFPRPDVAEGIFFEYFRTDNPMSTDFLDRVVEGFPFLLAPLSQIKGVTSPVISRASPQSDSDSQSNPFLRTIGGFGGVLSSQASSFADFLQNGAQEMSANAMETAKSMGLAARSLGEELEERRQLLGKHVLTFTSQAMSSFYSKDQKALSIPHQWISDQELSRISGELYKESARADEPPGTPFAGAFCRLLGLEECSLSFSDATQKLIFGLVHCFLLLLLIASFPTQTNVQMVVPKKSFSNSSHTDSDSDHESDEFSDEYSVGVRGAHLTSKNRMFVL